MNSQFVLHSLRGLCVLCALGDELTALHLMEQRGPNSPGFPVAGDKMVEGALHGAGADGTLGRVWINKVQYFEGIAPDVWEFQVGGCPVAQKWLKDRKGRVFTYDNLSHYQGVIAVLIETLRLITAIDDAITVHGGWPLT